MLLLEKIPQKRAYCGGRRHSHKTFTFWSSHPSSALRLFLLEKAAGTCTCLSLTVVCDKQVCGTESFMREYIFMRIKVHPFYIFFVVKSYPHIYDECA